MAGETPDSKYRERSSEQLRTALDEVQLGILAVWRTLGVALQDETVRQDATDLHMRATRIWDQLGGLYASIEEQRHLPDKIEEGCTPGQQQNVESEVA